MGTIDHLDFLADYQEDNRIEAKRAQGGLPHSLWETYSSFANTLGGVILLGVAEAEDKSLYSVSLPDPQKLVDEFWLKVNDPAMVSTNILKAEDVRILRNGGHSIVAIFVPRAEFRQRPVYVGQDPFFGTYYRKGEEDCRAPRHEVEAMLRDRDDPFPLDGLSRLNSTHDV
ncbi:MAG: helix-turn-helix domain-containing protein [Lawsonibacter sp.]